MNSHAASHTTSGTGPAVELSGIDRSLRRTVIERVVKVMKHQTVCGHWQAPKFLAIVIGHSGPATLRLKAVSDTLFRSNDRIAAVSRRAVPAGSQPAAPARIVVSAGDRHADRAGVRQRVFLQQVEPMEGAGGCHLGGADVVRYGGDGHRDVDDRSPAAR